jgi:hypothetical protein
MTASGLRVMRRAMPDGKTPCAGTWSPGFRALPLISAGRDPEESGTVHCPLTAANIPAKQPGKADGPPVRRHPGFAASRVDGLVSRNEMRHIMESRSAKDTGIDSEVRAGSPLRFHAGSSGKSTAPGCFFHVGRLNRRPDFILPAFSPRSCCGTRVTGSSHE